HEAANRQIETGRAVLPLVVAIGEEVLDLVAISRMPENVLERPVYLRITPAAPLVSRVAGVADAGEDQAVLDLGDAILVSSQPCDRADRARNEQKTIGVPSGDRRQCRCQRCRDSHSGEVVVAKRPVADLA